MAVNDAIEGMFGVDLAPEIATQIADPSSIVGAALRASSAGALPGLIATTECRTQSGDTTTAVGTSRLAHTARRAVRDVRLVYTHFSVANFYDSLPAGSITFRAAIEVGGVLLPVTFGGKRDAVVDAGFVVSDPLGVELAAGEVLFSRTYVSAGSPQNTSTAIPADGEGFTAGSDLTGAGSAAVTAQFLWVYGPAAVVGDTGPGVTFGIVGDSIAHGGADSGGRPPGFLVRAANAAGLPWLNVSRAGETVRDVVVNSQFRFRLPLVGNCSHVVCQYGRNDFTQSRTTAQVQADLIRLWTSLSARGSRVFQTTVTPSSTSTDSWATTANQTTHSSNAARVGLNDWLRAGAPMRNGSAVAAGVSGALVAGAVGHPLAGIFDVSDAVETARNSGIWKAGYTGDGIHPSDVAHAAMTAVVDLSRLL